MKIIIPGELTDLNTYIGALNRNRYVGNQIKRDETERVAWIAKKYRHHTLKFPVFIEFIWIVPNKRKDKDNISFAKKFILDGLVEGGVLPADSWKYLDDFSDAFLIDKDNPRTEIIIHGQT